MGLVYLTYMNAGFFGGFSCREMYRSSHGYVMGEGIFGGTCATNRRIFPHPSPANPSASSSVPSASREDEKGGRGGGKHVGVFFKGWNKKIR